MFSKENYEGFYLEWNLNPIKTITVKTIAIPRWLKRIFPKMCDFYRIPYKFGFK